MNRFNDDGTYLVEFLDDVWVICPTCGETGYVRCRQPYWASTPTFTCTHCARSFRGRHSRWFGPGPGIAARGCGRCGRPMRQEISGAARVIDRVDLHCADCGAASTTVVRWYFNTAGLAYEPSFGLALRLQAACQGHVLWAYNLRHLQFLRAYVAANIRERRINCNASLASRLPRWLKSARHRRAVLRTIGVLEARTTSQAK